MTTRIVLQYVLLISILVFNSSCRGITSNQPIEDLFEPISEVAFINGTENTILTVNRSQDSYFLLEFTNVGSNSILQDGEGEGWCIDWQKPIDSNGGMYNDIRLYSTFNVKKWNPVNFLLNIKHHLKSADPEITYREIQLAIWSLQGFPKFDLETVELNDLPSRMLQNGQPAFNAGKVQQILEIVEAGHRDFAFIAGTKYAVIAETPADVQTVITVAK
jgi:hypothetical protein